MKARLNRMMMSLLFVLTSSLAFVACSDDDGNVMGAVAINSCQFTATSVTPIWTLVPNSNCEGYIVTLYKGTRTNLGAVVDQKTFNNRTCQYTFTDLTPETDYVLSTQAIPSATSGFNDAEVYWREFKTASAQ